jgi:hypothetical protein
MHTLHYINSFSKMSGEHEINRQKLPLCSNSLTAGMVGTHGRRMWWMEYCCTYGGEDAQHDLLPTEITYSIIDDSLS